MTKIGLLRLHRLLELGQMVTVPQRPSGEEAEQRGNEGGEGGPGDRITVIYIENPSSHVGRYTVG